MPRGLLFSAFVNFLFKKINFRAVLFLSYAIKLNTFTVQPTGVPQYLLYNTPYLTVTWQFNSPSYSTPVLMDSLHQPHLCCLLCATESTGHLLSFLTVKVTKDFITMSFWLVTICPMAMAYSMGQIIKSFCVCAYVCLSPPLPLFFP